MVWIGTGAVASVWVRASGVLDMLCFDVSRFCGCGVCQDCKCGVPELIRVVLCGIL